jgi:hypothetical protein
VKVEIVPASPAHVGTVANRMRMQDARECWAQGTSPKRALRMGLLGSAHAVTVLIDGRPEAIAGVTPVDLLSGIGQPWMLGTPKIMRPHPAWVVEAPLMVAEWRRLFPVLRNKVAADNRKAIMWLRRLGFKVAREHVIVGGVRFLPFEWRA